MEIAPELLSLIKTSLRVTSAAFDAEISGIISACFLDLNNAGVVNTSQTDPLIQRAVTLYSKGHFGYGEDSDKYLKSYEMLKISLSLAGDYNGAVE